jgi:hypothetical protein
MWQGLHTCIDFNLNGTGGLAGQGQRAIGEVACEGRAG